VHVVDEEVRPEAPLLLAGWAGWGRLHLGRLQTTESSKMNFTSFERICFKLNLSQEIRLHSKSPKERQARLLILYISHPHPQTGNGSRGRGKAVLRALARRQDSLESASPLRVIPCFLNPPAKSPSLFSVLSSIWPARTARQGGVSIGCRRNLRTLIGWWEHG
jgi:hypothetical protein